MQGKILVVDDEIAILRLINIILGKIGYEVTTVESATEALALLERQGFDCIVTDAVMPDVTGFDLVKKVRSQKRHSTLPVLMLTQKRNRQDVKRAVEAGVTDYVFKPIDENLLIEKIESCLKKPGIGLSREYPLAGKLAESELSICCTIASIGESSMTLLLQSRLEGGTLFRVQSPVFGEIGIQPPALHLESCELSSSDAFSWQAKVSFSALSEADLARIRAWTRKVT